MEYVCICGVVILQPFKASDLKRLSEFLRLENYFMQILHEIYTPNCSGSEWLERMDDT